MTVRIFLPTLCMIRRQLTSGAQTTTPQPVRRALGVCDGGERVYEIEGRRVLLMKRRHTPKDGPFRTFEEWDP